MERGEEQVPDSKPDDVVEESPQPLGNLPDIFTQVRPHSHRNNDGMLDSQETRLSEETYDKLSEEIPMIPTSDSGFSVPLVSCLPVGLHTLEAIGQSDAAECERRTSTMDNSMNMVQNKVIGPEPISISVSKSESSKEPSSVLTSDVIPLYTASEQGEEIKCESSVTWKPPDWVGKYANIIKDLEEVERQVTVLMRELPSNPPDSKIKCEETKIRKMIADLAVVNKKEKDALMLHKKKNGKVCKEQLLGLAKCHRKLVSVVQAHKMLSKKIQDHDVGSREPIEVMECSQSLLPDPAKQDSSRVFVCPSSIPIPILKNSRPVVAASLDTETPTPRKVVKFHIPFRSNEQTMTSSEDSDAVTSADPVQARNTSNHVLMSDLFSRNTDDLDNGRVGKKLPSATIGVDKSSTSSTYVHQLSRTTEAARGNESVESMSLISGLSDNERFLVPPNHKTMIKARNVSLKHISISASGKTSSLLTPVSLPFHPGRRLAYNPVPVPVPSLLKLSEMIRKGMLFPGNNVLSCINQNKIFTVSLSPDGLLLGAEGEVFVSPMTWLKALSGTKCSPSRQKTYQSITYGGKTLYEICSNSIRHNTDLSSTVIATTQPTVVPQRNSVDCSPAELRIRHSALLKPSKVLLVQDDEFFKHKEVFGDMPSGYFGDIPSNIEDLFI